MRSIVFPHETDSPLVIDADAVLPSTVAFQRLKLVAWRDFQAGQFGGGMKLQELAPCHTLYVFEPGHDLAMKQRLRVGTHERMDHDGILFCETESVNPNDEGGRG
jgi:hypothetical protein